MLFAADDSCRAKLGEYAKKKLNAFARKYRLKIVNKSDACKKKYHDILADADIVSEQIFAIPENICVREDADGTEYENHLLASPETGIAKIKLNGWEGPLIEEESRRADFACWLRNPSRTSWALCLSYDLRGEKKSFYPDFLIVRRDPELDYVVDILEPHDPTRIDNLGKARGFAEYARQNPGVGRIQLIRMSKDAVGHNRFKRLDMAMSAVRDKVSRAMTNDELDHIFDTDGFFM